MNVLNVSSGPLAFSYKDIHAQAILLGDLGYIGMPPPESLATDPVTIGLLIASNGVRWGS